MNMLNNIKNSFSIFKEKNKFYYFDNAATTLVPDCVVDAWSFFYRTCCGSPGRGAHYFARNAEAIMESSRSRIKQFFSVPNEADLIFCSGATDAINSLSYNLNSFLQPGDIILVSEYEHNSNFLPWKRLAEEKSAHLEIIPIDKSGELDFSILDYLSGCHIAIAAFPYISNVNGYAFPIEILNYLKSQGTIIVLDSVQGAAHMKLDFSSLNVDFMVVTAHKMYGPKGIGGFIGKKELLERMNPFKLGGGIVSSVNYKEIVYKESPARFEPGTQDAANCYAWAETCKWIDSLNFEDVINHEKKLYHTLKSELLNIKAVQILPNGSKNSAPILSFVSSTVHSHDLNHLLNERNIIIRTGSMCAPLSLHAFEVSSINRISFGVYNTLDDLGFLIEQLKKIYKTQ